jgi:hypothetical protein
LDDALHELENHSDSVELPQLEKSPKNMNRQFLLILLNYLS